MEIYIAEQCKSLAESFIMGLIFGAGYDIINILYYLCGIQSKECTKGAAFWLYFVGDSLYMVWMTICSSLFLYCTNYGQLRLYLVCGSAAGFWLYRKSISKLVTPVLEQILFLIKRVLRVTVICPLVCLLNRLLSAGRWCFRIAVSVFWGGLQRLWLRGKLSRIRRRFRNFVRL